MWLRGILHEAVRAVGRAMRLRDFDLEQLDREGLQALSVEQKDALILQLVQELQEALDRLGQNAQNSSRPPSSAPPWAGASGENQEAEKGGSSGEAHETPEPPVQEGGAAEPTHTQAESKAGAKEKRKAGRQKGATGHSRRVAVPLTGEQCHYPQQCVGCGEALDGQGFVASTGLYVLDVELGAQGVLGLEVKHERHIYGEIVCWCGQVNRSEPGRCAPEAEWQVELTEWHIVGPMLAALIVCLSQRMLVSRVRIQEFLTDWLGIYLSTSTIN